MRLGWGGGRGSPTGSLEKRVAVSTLIQGALAGWGRLPEWEEITSKDF